jgi:hypothetical protein
MVRFTNDVVISIKQFTTAAKAILFGKRRGGASGFLIYTPL